MVSSESSEMYLETIYLMERDHGHAHGVEIARHLEISKASVTKAMKKLKEDGLIDKESYGSITLTPKGKKISEKIYRNHRMISLFLEKTLGVSQSLASENACRMEHILTDELLESIEGFLTNQGLTTLEGD